MPQCTSCGLESASDESKCPDCGSLHVSYVSLPKTAFIDIDALEVEDVLPTEQKSVAVAERPLAELAPGDGYVAPSLPLPRSYQPATRPSRQAKLMALLVGILITTLLTMVSRAYYDAIYYPSQLHVQRTAIAALLNATTTAMNVAATIQAKADAEPITTTDLYAQISSRKPTYEDALADTATSDWITDQAADGAECTFKDGSLEVQSPSDDHFFYCHNQHTLSNFLFTVQMTIVQGDEGVITFRANPDSNMYYALFVNNGGDYALYAYHGNNGKDAQLLSQFGLVRFVTGVGSTNTISILARDNTMTLFVNNNDTGDVVDSDKTYSRGLIGLGASDHTQATTVTFSKARIWEF